MNRAERRSRKKNVDWIKSLSTDKQAIIAELIRDASEREAKESTVKMLEQVETCIAASITKNLNDGITFDEIVQVLKDTDEFLLENAEFIHKFRGEWKKKLDNIEPKIVEKMEGMLRNGATKKEIVEVMRKEFKDITNAHIYNAFKAAQGNLRKELPVEEVKPVPVVEPVEVKEIEEVKEVKEMKEMTIIEQLQEELDMTCEDIDIFENKIKEFQEKLKEVKKKGNALNTAINALKEVM